MPNEMTGAGTGMEAAQTTSESSLDSSKKFGSARGEPASGVQARTGQGDSSTPTTNPAPHDEQCFVRPAAPASIPDILKQPANSEAARPAKGERRHQTTLSVHPDVRSYVASARHAEPPMAKTPPTNYKPRLKSRSASSVASPSPFRPPFSPAVGSLGSAATPAASSNKRPQSFDDYPRGTQGGTQPAANNMHAAFGAGSKLKRLKKSRKPSGAQAYPVQDSLTYPDSTARADSTHFESSLRIEDGFNGGYQDERATPLLEGQDHANDFPYELDPHFEPRGHGRHFHDVESYVYDQSDRHTGANYPINLSQGHPRTTPPPHMPLRQLPMFADQNNRSRATRHSTEGQHAKQHQNPHSPWQLEPSRISLDFDLAAFVAEHDLSEETYKTRLAELDSAASAHKSKFEAKSTEHEAFVRNILKQVSERDCLLVARRQERERKKQEALKSLRQAGNFLEPVDPKHV